MAHPYHNQLPEQRWRSGVAEQQPGQVKGLYLPRFSLPKSAIATAGSCFAQHIAHHLNSRGWSVLDVEPPPPGMSIRDAKAFQYRIYSARYGNIYTARQLRELAQEAMGGSMREVVWERDGRYFDAFRPGAEPQGLSSVDEVLIQRRDHIARVRTLLQTADFWIFTLGLTEAWTDGTYTYPTAPGVIAGNYDPCSFNLQNFDVDEVVEDLEVFRSVVRELRPDPRFLLTVSPVPLAATATSQHILSATMYSKAVLRAAAGKLYDRYEDIDYFPSFELVFTPFAKGMWFEQDMRNVRPDGVEMVMRHFFADHENLAPRQFDDAPEDVVCEEALLQAFG